MPEAVVDDLEIVEREGQDGALFRVRRLTVPERLLQPVVEEQVVREAGERVEGLEIGEVRLRAGDPGGRAVRVSHCQPTREHPPKRPRCMSNPVLALEVRRSARQMRLEALLDASQIVRVDAVEPLTGLLANGVLIEAHDRLPPGREIDRPVSQIPIPQPVVGALRGQRVTLLADPQARFGLFARQLRPDSRQDHRVVDRLGDVVVRAAIQRGDDVLALILGGHHQHGQRRRRPSAANFLQDLEPAHLGHLNVEQHQLGGLRGKARQGLAAARGGLHGEAAPLESARQQVPVGLHVVDDEQGPQRVSHGGLGNRAGCRSSRGACGCRSAWSRTRHSRPPAIGHGPTP